MNEVTRGREFARKDFYTPYQSPAEKKSSRSDKKKPLDRKRKRKLLKRIDFQEGLKESQEDKDMHMWFYRPVLAYTMDVLSLTATQVEFLLFLYRFDHFESGLACEYFMTSQNQKKKLFNGLVKRGFIIVKAYGIHSSNDPELKAKYANNIYILSQGAKMACSNFHKYLSGEKQIPVYY